MFDLFPGGVFAAGESNAEGWTGFFLNGDESIRQANQSTVVAEQTITGSDEILSFASAGESFAAVAFLAEVQQNGGTYNTLNVSASEVTIEFQSYPSS